MAERMTTFEALGRELKAAKLADWLIEHKFTAAEVRTAVSEDESWKILAKGLGMRIASVETRRVVVEAMEREEHRWAGENVA